MLLSQTALFSFKSLSRETAEITFMAEGTHLGVCSLRLCDGAVEGGAGGESLSQALIDLAQLL